MNGETTTHTGNNVSIFLFGAILHILAAVDYVSLVDYSLKAFLGGLIWLMFKLVGDFIAEKIKQRKEGKNGN